MLRGKRSWSVVYWLLTFRLMSDGFCGIYILFLLKRESFDSLEQFCGACRNRRNCGCAKLFCSWHRLPGLKNNFTVLIISFIFLSFFFTPCVNSCLASTKLFVSFMCGGYFPKINFTLNNDWTAIIIFDTINTVLKYI